MTPAELDNLLNNQVAEDLYLDYKHGNLLNNSRPAATTIRKYMSGFANSDGGILIIGVDESNWSVTGATAPGGRDLAQWAARCLTPIASYFSPIPRFQVINHPDGNVLVATTARSLGVVPYTEAGQIVHYFRIHDQTLKAPEYLVSDILLGRRRQDYMQITGLDLRYIQTYLDEHNKYWLHFSPVLLVENQGLLRGKIVRVGIVSLVKERNSLLLSNHLLSYINVTDHSIDPFGSFGPCSHEIQTVDVIEPFCVGRFGGYGNYKIPISMNGTFITPYIWKAAVYLTSEDSAPLWYQMNLTVSGDLLELRQNNDTIHSQDASPFYNIEPLVGSQPTVELEQIPDEV